MTPAIAFSKLLCVTIKRGVTPRSTSSTASSPARDRDLFLGRVVGRDVVPAHGRDAEHRAGGRHRVGRELAAAGAGARAGVVLDVLELVLGDPAGVIGAERLVHVLDRELAVAEHPVRLTQRPMAIEPP